MKRISHGYRSCLAGALLCAALTAGAQSTPPLREALLKNPAQGFQIDPLAQLSSRLQPTWTVEEGEFLQSIAQEVQTDPKTVAAKIEALLTPESTAMFDYLLGVIYYGQFDDPEKGLLHFRNAVKKFPNFREVHKNLGILALQNEQYQEALDSLVRSVELGADDSNAYGLIGYVYTALEKYTAAEAAYRIAIMKDPATKDWQVGLANSLMLQSKHEEAIALLTELLAKDPTNEGFWKSQANAFISLDRSGRAAQNFEFLARMDRAGPEIYNALGSIYIFQDLPDLALDYYLTSISLPQKPKVETPLAAADVILGRGLFESAEKLLDAIAEAYGDELSGESEVKYLRLRAQLALAGTDQVAAQQALEALVEKDPGDAQTLMLLASFYVGENKYDEAKPLFERAAEIEGFEADARVQHAQELVRLERYADAIQLLDEAQMIDPQPHVGRYLEEVRRVYRSSL